MKIEQIAEKLYLEKGYNCTESILHSLNQANIISISDEILQIGTGFKSGIAGNGCVCGVISAGIISIGLCYGKINKKEVNEQCNKFYKKFIEKYKITCCRVLTKQWKDDFSNSERKNFCAKIIQEMIIELEKILKKEGNR